MCSASREEGRKREWRCRSLVCTFETDVTDVTKLTCTLGLQANCSKTLTRLMYIFD